jgi:anaerobic selenocysteine-containing dehydrogenase
MFPDAEESDSAERTAPAERPAPDRPAPEPPRRGSFAGRLARRALKAGARRVLDRGRSDVPRRPARPAPAEPHTPAPAATTASPTAPPQAAPPPRAIDSDAPAPKKKRTSSRDDWAERSARTPEVPNADLPTIAHTGELDDLPGVPGYLLPPNHDGTGLDGRLSCAYCGVGDSGQIRGTDRHASRVGQRSPTKGCAKLQTATGHSGTMYPLHVQPSIKDRFATQRRPISYKDAISRFADLCLDHRDPDTQVLVYGCGQIDYFTIFAMQEVFRLLGIRNVAGNAEHCLNAGAVHNEMLTGQEGPFLTYDSAFDGPHRFFLLNGWNGRITHPGAWHRLMGRRDFDGYIVDVMETESTQQIAKRLGDDRVLLIRSSGDPELALSVAHTILTRHPQAVEQRFIDQYADHASWRGFRDLAREARFEAEATAARIAPEAHLQGRLIRGIEAIAARIADPDTVPINIPSVGLSQTAGAVGHCLWGNTLAMVGKYGLNADGTTAGGTLRIPGQINAQTEIQALSRLFFFGRIPVTDDGAVEAARRMGLPDDSYELAVRDEPRPVLDYSVRANEYDRELIIAFGTQFEANMMDRTRWLEKLTDPNTTLVVVDPVPDPFTLEHAHLIIPSPPHAAAPKLYQNGEWRMSLSVPRKRAAPETRSDATILYDTMAEISRRIRTDSMLRMIHPDLGFHSQSGYLRERFEDLPRIDGEVSRWHLWQRVQEYCRGGEGRTGPLYCRPVHTDGREISWEELLEAGSLMYGGVGETRYRLAYDEPDHVPFRDVFERPRKFTFFLPTEEDLRLPTGIVLNSGRSAMSDDPKRIRFAVNTFNSGKATPRRDMPDEHPLHISPLLAAEQNLTDGDRVRLTGVHVGRSIEMTVSVTSRLVGHMAYVPFHKDKLQADGERYINTVTSQAGRCAYTAQTSVKATTVTIERIAGSGILAAS